ncbi:PAS-domain containing protein [Rhodovibrionaceae bacterium A322]
MLRLPRRVPWIIITTVTCLLLLAAGYLANRLYLERDFLLSNYRNATWVAVQARNQLLRLEEAVLLYQLEPTEENRASLSVRLDLLWSRFPILLDSPEGEAARSVPGMLPKLEALHAQLPDLEQELSQLRPDNPEGWKKVHDRLQGFYHPLNELIRKVLINDSINNKKEISLTALELVLALVLIFLCSVVSIILLIRQLRDSEKLRHDKELVVAEVKELEALLSDGLESISEAFLLLDGEGRVLRVNRKFRETYPIPEAELVPGVPFKTPLLGAAMRGKFLTPMSAEKFVEDRQRKSETRQSSWEERLTDGRIFLVREQATSLGGRVAIYTDVSELKAAEALLHQRLEVIEGSLDGTALFDPFGRTTYVNKALLAHLGYRDSARFIGKSWALLFGAQEDRDLIDFMNAEAVKKARWRGEVRLESRNGNLRVFDISLTRQDDGGIILSAHDISDLKSAETERLQLQSQFCQSQKMEALGRLSGGIAHDFNNITASVLGFATFLKEDLADRPEQQGYAEKIIKVSHRANDLIGQIIAFSRRDDSEHNREDLCGVIQNATALMQGALKRGAELEVDCAMTEAPLNANAGQLSQALMNVLGNAQLALNDGKGKIHLALDRLAVTGQRAAALSAISGNIPSPQVLQLEEGAIAGSHRLWVGLLSAGDYYLITITDNGVGMSSQVLQQIFEPFYSTRNLGAGSGLGLSAVHGIITNHGGAFDVESKLGEGTVFRLFLPVNSSAAQSDGQSVRPWMVGQGGKVLLASVSGQKPVDLLAPLKDLGLELDFAGSLEAARFQLKDKAETFQALIVDFDDLLPPGRSEILQVLNLNLEVPVVVLALLDKAAEDGLVSEIAAGKVLQKPLSRITLVRSLARHLAKIQTQAAE